MKNIRTYLAAAVLTTSLAVAPISTFAETTNNVDQPSYTVVKGDTLYKIATTNGTTVEELMALNGLTSYTLSIGQKLVLTSTETTTPSATYTVVKGDTLYKIATTHGTTVEELMKWNSLSSYTISIGQVLKTQKPVSYLTHKVVKGDTLYRIATQNKVTVESVMALNDLHTYNVYVGQVLKVKAN